MSPSVKRLRGEYWIRQRRIRWMVRLPSSFDFFLLRNSRANPLGIFLIWLAEELGGLREGWALDVSEVHLIAADAEALMERERFWWARRGDESQANWTGLDIGPNEVGDREDGPVPDVVVPGWVYVGEKVYVRRDKGRRRGGRAHVIDMQDGDADGC